MLGEDKKSQMKNMKRSERRHQAKFKLERRIEIWVHGFNTFIAYDGTVYRKGKVAEVKEEVRKGRAWKFLRHTSTPCSCHMCAYNKYKRVPKHKVVKKAFSEE